MLQDIFKEDDGFTIYNFSKAHGNLALVEVINY